MYFNKFSRINYTIGNREYELLNIFTRVTFLYDYSTSSAWSTYSIQEGETPEDIAFLVYGDTLLSWFVILQNNILSDDEWYGGDAKFSTILSERFSGEAYYITNLPDVKEGDLIVKVSTVDGYTVTQIDSSIYRIVKNFDKNFRYVWGVRGSGTFLPNDKIAFARKDATGAITLIRFADSLDTTQTTEFATLRYVENKTTAPIHFITLDNLSAVPQMVEYDGQILSGYVTPNNISTNSEDTNLNFADTLLYYYMTNNGQTPGVSKYTYYTDLYRRYYVGQNIRLLKPQYISPVISEIQNLISGDTIGKRVTIGLR